MSKRSLHSERGGMAVLIGVLFMVVFVAFTALVVDTGAAFQERRELQNAADAGALAIAYACARGDEDCDAAPSVTAWTLAATLADQNASDGMATVTDIRYDGNEVTVETESRNAEGAHFFQWLVEFSRSGIFGDDAPNIDPITVVAPATASYDASPSALTTLPLALSGCEFDKYLDGHEVGEGPEVTIIIKGTGPGDEDCVAPAGGAITDGEPLEGGFRWLDTDSSCVTATTVEGWIASDGGASLPDPNCETPLEALVGAPAVPLPLFDDICKGGGGDGIENCSNVGLGTSPKGYHIFGYVGLRVTGIRRPPAIAGDSTCSNPGDFCIKGFFEPAVADGPPGGPDLGGVSTVRLIAD